MYLVLSINTYRQLLNATDEAGLPRFKRTFGSGAEERGISTQERRKLRPAFKLPSPGGEGAGGEVKRYPPVPGNLKSQLVSTPEHEYGNRFHTLTSYITSCKF